MKNFLAPAALLSLCLTGGTVLMAMLIACPFGIRPQWNKEDLYVFGGLWISLTGLLVWDLARHRAKERQEKP